MAWSEHGASVRSALPALLPMRQRPALTAAQPRMALRPLQVWQSLLRLCLKALLSRKYGGVLALLPYRPVMLERGEGAVLLRGALRRVALLHGLSCCMAPLGPLPRAKAVHCADTVPSLHAEHLFADPDGHVCDQALQVYSCSLTVKLCVGQEYLKSLNFT